MGGFLGIPCGLNLVFINLSHTPSSSILIIIFVIMFLPPEYVVYNVYHIYPIVNNMYEYAGLRISSSTHHCFTSLEKRLFQEELFYHATPVGLSNKQKVTPHLTLTDSPNSTFYAFMPQCPEYSGIGVRNHRNMLQNVIYCKIRTILL